MDHPKIGYFNAWLLYTVSAILTSTLAGVLLGAAGGLVYAFTGIPQRTISIVASAIGIAVTLVASFLLFRVFVRRLIVNRLLEQSSDAQDHVA
jgi:hypothetical protein